MQTKRLFIAASLKDDVFKYHFADIREDFEGALFGKWVEPENFHLTLKFLGDTDINLIPQITSSLADILGTNNNSLLTFTGLGAFPSIHSPRVLFASLSSGAPKLIELAKLIDERLFSIGIPKETKPFKPHFTLCRPKEFNYNNFSEAVAKYSKFEFGSSDGFSVSLFESELTRKGPIYTKIK